jgi:hypothetical protein
MRRAERHDLKTRRRPHTDRFGAALLLIVATIVLAALAGDSGWGQVLAIAVEGGTLLFILIASNARPSTRRVAAILVFAALMSSVAAAVAEGEASKTMPVVVGALLALVVPVAIARRLRDHERISSQTIFGALCLYLLAGLFFAFVYASINAIQGDFFSQAGDHNSLDFVYFSFVTLATVGYGDLTARADLGRMLAVSEALMGQLYLVSVVALLVSNIGRTRGPRDGREERDARPTPAPVPPESPEQGDE